MAGSLSSALIGPGDRLIGLLLISLLAFKFLPLSLFLATFTAMTSILLWFQYDDKFYWQRMGVPGPPANIFLGNMHQLSRDGIIEFDKKNLQKYGKSFGAYFLGRHEFLTMDMDILRRILVKDFPNFPNRLSSLQSMLKDEPELIKLSLMMSSVANLVGDDWKRVRNIITPAFTTGKLKKLIPFFRESTNRMGDFIEREYIPANKQLPLKDLFVKLVFDEIGRGGFSLDLNMFKGEGEEHGQKEHPFVTNARKIMGFMLWEKYLAFFPFILYLFIKITHHIFTEDGGPFFKQMLNDLYEQRKAEQGAQEKYSDLFQLLMNTVNEEKEEEEGHKDETKQNGMATVVEHDADIMHKEIWATTARTKGKKRMSRMELISQSFVLLVAGFDTTASTLHYAVYVLAMEQDIQDKLRQEIRDILGDEEEVTHEHLKQMHYLQAVIRETLRFYSLAIRINRECTEDIDLDEIVLRKGDIVSVPVLAIHHSEEFYPEPEKFMPERFMPDQKSARDPLSFLAFGFGPRNCVGMRFAEFQMHVALALLVRRFRFKPGPITPKLPLKFQTNFGFLRPVEQLTVLAEKI